MIAEKQSNFLNYEIWILTFGGGLQRSGVYEESAADEQRSEFRKGVRVKISELVKSKYTKIVESEDHISNLLYLQRWIDDNYSEILANNHIKLGVVQKIFNLYLKYQWCLGLVKTPPHCPFDRIIISKFKLLNPPAWTKLDSVEVYRNLVNEAKKLAGGKSISEWELEVFLRR
jgi:hypothetical protein